MLTVAASAMAGRSAQLGLQLALQLPTIENNDTALDCLRNAFGVRVFLVAEIREKGVLEKHKTSALYLQLAGATFALALLSYTSLLPTPAKIIIFSATLTILALALFALLAGTDPDLPSRGSLDTHTRATLPASARYSHTELETIASAADYVLLDDELLTVVTRRVFSTSEVSAPIAISFVLDILRNRVKLDPSNALTGLLDLSDMSLASWEAVTDTCAYVVDANIRTYEEHAASEANLPSWAKTALIVLLSHSGYTYTPRALSVVQKLTDAHLIRHTCQHTVSRSQDFRVLWASIRRAVHPRAHHHTHILQRVLSARFCSSHCRHESLHDWSPAAHPDARWHMPDVMAALADTVHHHLPELALGAWHPEAEQALFTLLTWARDHQTENESGYSEVVLDLVGRAEMIFATPTTPPRITAAFLRFLASSTLIHEHYQKSCDPGTISFSSASDCSDMPCPPVRRTILRNICRSLEVHATGATSAEAGMQELDVLRMCQRPFWMFDATAQEVHKCWPEWTALFHAMSVVLRSWHDDAGARVLTTWTSRLAGHCLASISQFSRNMPPNARARGVVFPSEMTETLHLFLLPDAFDGLCPRRELGRSSRDRQIPCFQQSTGNVMASHGFGNGEWQPRTDDWVEVPEIRLL